MRDTIDLIHEAGIRDCTCSGSMGCLKRFEALVRADERDRAMRENAYVQAEREACAKVCEDTPWSNWFTADCAAAIRARGNT